MVFCKVLDQYTAFECRGPEDWIVDIEGDAAKSQPDPIHSEVAENAKSRRAVSRSLDVERW